MERKTEIKKSQNQPTPPAVLVKVEKGTTSAAEFKFTSPFRIGRDRDCEIRFEETVVSRVHAEIVFEDKKWWIRDLNSSNGTFKYGKQITREPIAARTTIEFGPMGPRLTFEIEGMEDTDKTIQGKAPSLTEYKEHYFGDADTNVGQHTLMVRKAFKDVKRRMSGRYIKIIAVIAALFVIAAAYAAYKHHQVQQQEELAKSVFYEMKSLELAYSQLETHVTSAADTTIPQVAQYFSKRNELLNSYEKFINELGIYGEGMSEEEKTIYRVARIFGECEIDMPDDFVDEVRKYIRLWKTSGRLVNAIRRAEENGLGDKIAKAMITNDMPPMFFYLALQESDFDPTICGPSTRFGIAKGMWQFIPATAVQYGLRTGPLVGIPKMDPLDERHDVDKSTAAAARYIRDIYKTEAQASGLLVIASYNWGHNVVKGHIRRMPVNPRERNFWTFLSTYRDKIPKETYNYVFYIVSAAVIGEHPELYGFDFQNPLQNIQVASD